MIEKVVVVTHENGIHMKPSAHIVEEAAKYKCSITIIKDGIKSDAKSMMEVMMMAAELGDKITVRADGEDEVEAVETLGELISSNFCQFLDINK